jgi:hypothetical protein
VGPSYWIVWGETANQSCTTASKWPTRIQQQRELKLDAINKLRAGKKLVRNHRIESQRSQQMDGKLQNRQIRKKCQNCGKKYPQKRMSDKRTSLHTLTATRRITLLSSERDSLTFSSMWSLIFPFLDPSSPFDR